jgi:hypothetical protein
MERQLKPACRAVVLATIGCILCAPLVSAQTNPIPRGYSNTVFQVKFVEGAPIDRPTSLLSAEVQGTLSDIRPLFSLPPQTLTECADAGFDPLV